jgi:hypothetical protein
MVGAASLALALHTGVLAQQTPLPAEAEYEGAFLRTAPNVVVFHESGKLRNGVLKVDYIRDGITYQADTYVWFFEDGTVSNGVLRAPTRIGDLTFEAGHIEYYPSRQVKKAVVKESTTVDNLFIPLRSDVMFREDGRIFSVQPQSQNNQTYRVLHRTIRGNNYNVTWNPQARQYEFQNYTTGVSQLVARIATQWTQASIPVPATVVPVIVPPGSTMTRNNANPAESFWVVPTPGNFVLNGVNYGPGPLLKVRDMQLLSIQVRQPVVIGGVTYPANTSVAFDGAGRPSPIGM